MRIIGGMTTRALRLLLLLGVVAMPLSAGERSRAVRLTESTYSSRVLDSATNRPVIDAEVSAGGRVTRTDPAGAFSILLPTARATALTVRRTGYEPITLIVTANPFPGTVVSPPIGASPPAPVAMVPRAPATITLTSGARKLVDDDSIQFGYVLPFASPITDASTNFCRGDGTLVPVGRAEIRRIAGPARATAHKPCCANGDVLAIDVEMRERPRETLYFADSCSGYGIVIVARERESGAFLFVDVKEIEEVVFP
ncbi:MAG TPA: hypothetical protein VFL80_09685 [Thermoanaerobaculia bacterium]|nr:hypothetical protein [Thermoanaerobaculia bacterium]